MALLRGFDEAVALVEELQHRLAAAQDRCGRKQSSTRRRGRASGTASTSPMVAAGPLVIMTMRSDSSTASSTSWVIMIVVDAEPGMDVHHRVLQMGARQRVERAERLVEQQDLRLHGKRPGNADALLHAARNLGRALVLGMRHLHEVEIAHDPVMPLGPALGAAEHFRHRQIDVLVDGEPRQQEWFWNTTARSGPGLSTSLFSSSTAPAETLVSPAIRLSKVDLPQPEWPMIETNSPLSMVSLMSFSTSLT